MSDRQCERGFSIGVAGNTMIPALQSIVGKGYSLTVWHSLEANGDIVPRYDAELDGRAYSGTSCEELLGLISLWEVRGDDWQAKEGEDELWKQLMDASVIYDSDGNVLDPK